MLTIPKPRNLQQFNMTFCFYPIPNNEFKIIHTPSGNANTV